MNRRNFLKALSAAGIMLGSPNLFRPVQAAELNLPAGFAPSVPKILINIILDGGPDFRHLIVPKFVSDKSQFGYLYWKHRATAHSIAQQNAAYQARWDNDYLKPVLKPAASGQEFGILNNAGWLFDMWEAGNAAIVNNALVSNSRDHSHSLLILEQGDRNTGTHDLDKPGWGGRLIKAIQDQAQQSDPAAQFKIVSLTREVRRFCYCPDPADARKHTTAQVVSVRDSRNLGLYDSDPTAENYSALAPQTVMSRALKAYYAAKQKEMPSSSPYYRFIQHEKDLRFFSEAMKARLIGDDAQNPNIPIPDSIRALYDAQFANENGLFPLNNTYFGKQIRNLYDCLAAQDILDFRIASMDYGGWDSHKNQQRYIEQRFQDLFHHNGGIATLYKTLPEYITDQLVFVISGEFGRQLKSNGDNGTDHGRGNSILVLGKGIKGGMYGDPFPADEVDKIDQRSPDITGKTGLEHIFGAVADSLEPNTANTVFPQKADAPLEEGLNAQLFI